MADHENNNLIKTLNEKLAALDAIVPSNGGFLRGRVKQELISLMAAEKNFIKAEETLKATHKVDCASKSEIAELEQNEEVRRAAYREARAAHQEAERECRTFQKTRQEAERVVIDIFRNGVLPAFISANKEIETLRFDIQTYEMALKEAKETRDTRIEAMRKQMNEMIQSHTEKPAESKSVQTNDLADFETVNGELWDHIGELETEIQKFEGDLTNKQARIDELEAMVDERDTQLETQLETQIEKMHIEHHCQQNSIKQLESTLATLQERLVNEIGQKEFYQANSESLNSALEEACKRFVDNDRVNGALKSNAFMISEKDELTSVYSDESMRTAKESDVDMTEVKHEALVEVSDEIPVQMLVQQVPVRVPDEASVESVTCFLKRRMESGEYKHITNHSALACPAKKKDGKQCSKNMDKCPFRFQDTAHRSAINEKLALLSEHGTEEALDVIRTVEESFQRDFNATGAPRSVRRPTTIVKPWRR